MQQCFPDLVPEVFHKEITLGSGCQIPKHSVTTIDLSNSKPETEAMDL